MADENPATINDPKPAASRRYKQVGLRDAETGRRYTKNLKLTDFQSMEEMDAFAKKLQAEQKTKNAAWRAAQKRQVIEAALARTPEPIVLPAIAPAADGLPDVTIRDSLRFSLDEGTGSTILLLGSSKRGKSHLMMRIYEDKFRRKDTISTLFSDNPHLKVYGSDKDLLCAYGFGDRHAKYIQMQHYINVKTKNEYKFANFLDDIVDRKNSPIVNKMVLTYRNAGISLIIALQYLMLMSKMNRSNINHTFCFGMNSAEDEMSVIKNMLRPYFAQMGLKRLDDMVRFYRVVTRDHGFIHIDNVRGEVSFHRLSD